MIKKRLTIFFLVLFISTNSFSQTIIWEKLFNYFPNGESIYSIDQDSDSTLVFTNSNGNNTAIVRMKLNGDTLWKKNTNINSCFNSERIVSFQNDKYVHFGNKNTQSLCSDNKFLFQKFGVDGTLISTWEYGDNGVKNFLHNGIVLSNGGFLASGLRQSTYYYYLSLMKLDNSGNLLWYKKYRDICGWTPDVIVNSKSNYLLSTSSGDQITSPVYHPYFIEVNSNGDSINSKYIIIHADTVNEMNHWKGNILQNVDENYVFAISIDSVQQKGGTLLDRYAAVVMMDTLFNIKWKLYLNKGMGGGYFPTKLLELKDSTYVLIIMNESNTFYFYKISKIGQVLNQKIFTSSICNKIFVPEIKLLCDSSLVVSGACVDASPNNDAYIARIKGVGLPMVITTTDPSKLKEQPSEWSVEVFPNPFTENTSFKIVGNIVNTNYILSLFNNLGKEIVTSSFSGREYILEKGDLSPGLYYYKISSEELTGDKSGKLVIE